MSHRLRPPAAGAAGGVGWRHCQTTPSSSQPRPPRTNSDDKPSQDGRSGHDTNLDDKHPGSEASEQAKNEIPQPGWHPDASRVPASRNRLVVGPGRGHRANAYRSKDPSGLQLVPNLVAQPFVAENSAPGDRIHWRCRTTSLAIGRPKELPLRAPDRGGAVVFPAASEHLAGPRGGRSPQPRRLIGLVNPDRLSDPCTRLRDPRDPIPTMGPKASEAAGSGRLGVGAAPLAGPPPQDVGNLSGGPTCRLSRPSARLVSLRQ